MDIRVGMVQYRAGTPVASVAWSIGFVDSWVGHYLLMVRGLPYASWDVEDLFMACQVPKDILFDLADLLVRRQFNVCQDVCDSWEECNRAEYDAAARVGAHLKEMLAQYQEGDEFHYRSDD